MTILAELPDFSQCHIAVVGDVMLDRYWSGGTARISPEAPVPVVRVSDDDGRAGGAGNVALNLAALGCQTTCVGIVGEDDSAAVLRSAFSQAGVTDGMQVANVETITKLRVISRSQQLIRLDFEPEPAVFAEVDLLPKVQTILGDTAEQNSDQKTDVLLLSDYAKGALHQCQAIIQLARARDVPVVIDPKGSDFSRYRGATVLTPNLHEFEVVVGVCADEQDLVTKGQSLLRELDLVALLVTRSEQGMTLLRRDQAAVHFPTLAREVFDVTGAGDTVIATLAAAIAMDIDWPDAARLANTAAGLVVAKSGAAQVQPAELSLAMALPGAYTQKLLTEQQLVAQLNQDDNKHKTWVMTNGCFDVLHPGHVAYLEQARALGDGLIVAVNDDASVQRLKGSERPVNHLAARMAVLAGLAAVDYVVSFADDTPADLIAAVMPDILVKGGDYQPEQVAGGEAVIANGGRVQILGFVDGYSTSQTIAKIKQT